MSSAEPMTLRAVLRSNLRRATAIALFVGTALVFINHGDHLAREPACDSFYVKCGLSYVVPFMVSMVSALLAARSQLRKPEHGG